LKKKQTFLFFLLLVLSSRVYGQEHDNVPSFVVEVYDDIFEAMSNGRMLKPKLVGTAKPVRVASYWPRFGTSKEKTFLIDDQFIEIARSFGKDSSNVIAHIMGHELAHLLLQQYEFLNDIGSAYASTDYSKSVKKNLSKKLQSQLKDSIFERQADEHAVFYAHIAGYKTSHIGSAVLDSIYRIYGFCDRKLKSYPPLHKRKEIVDKSAQRMESLLVLYEFGIASLLSNEFDLAIQLFEIVLEEGFQSKEVFNNLGLSYFQKGLSLIHEDSLHYVYPFDIDFTSNLEQERSFGSTNEEIEEYFLKSGECFDNALSIDEEYIKALTNKAILQFHTGSRKLVITLAELDVLAAETDNYKILVSLIQHQKGDSIAAIKDLEELAIHNICAKINLQKIKTNNDSTLIYASEVPSSLVIKIYDHHFFGLDREDESLKNMRDFKSCLRHSKKKISSSMRILEDESIYSMKWKSKGSLYKMNIILDRDLIRDIGADFNQLTSQKVGYFRHGKFVLKYIDSKLVQCFLIL
jgi:tetratricopeptide (TPR) repeat protein